MRVLVTGSAGFIGSRIVEALTAHGHEIVGYDVRTDPACDVRDPDAVRRALAGVDAVCHQAAMVGLGVDFADAPLYVSHNDVGTAVLLAAMAQAGVRRLVLAGSMVVYGEGRYTCARHGTVRPGPRAVADLDAGRFEPRCPQCGADLSPGLVGEDAPVDPRNVYATTKLAQEHLAAAWARATGGAAVALRYHNVYGPGMPRDTPYAGVASFFRSALARGEAPRVFEDGGQRRDFVHVRDVAAANVAALEASSPMRRAHLVQHRQRRAAHGRRDGTGAGGRVRRPRPGGDRGVPARGRTAHHGGLGAAAGGAGVEGGGRIRRGNAGVRGRGDEGRVVRGGTGGAARVRKRPWAAPPLAPGPGRRTTRTGSADGHRRA